MSAPEAPARASVAVPPSGGDGSADGAPRGGCACAMAAPEDGASGERRAVGVDADAKTRNLTRLRRIEGQVRGLQRMVEEDRYCADVMTQIASVHEALRSVGKELMRSHLRHCATAAIRAGDDEAERMYEELLGLMYRAVR